MARIREELGLTQAPAWSVYYYPAQGEVGLIEFALSGGEEESAAVQNGQEPSISGALDVNEKN